MLRNYTTFFALSLILVIFCSCSMDGKKEDTSSGYTYIHHVVNDGKLPEIGDYVFFQLTLTGDSGVVIQDARNLPNMPSIQILDENAENYRSNPLNEMLSQMSVGDSATLVFPVDSLPSIPVQFKDHENIYYTAVLKEIKSREKHMEDMRIENEKRQMEIAAVKALEPEMQSKTANLLNQYNSGAFDEVAIETESGLKLILHEKGEGDLPELGYTMAVNYFVMLMDGTPVDNNFRTGNKYLFKLESGGIIDGWVEAFQLLNKGTKASLIVPYELAYGVGGRPGSIPEKADLFFYVELLDFYNY